MRNVHPVTRQSVVRGALALTVAAAVVANLVVDSAAVADACYLGVLVGASIGAGIGAARAPRGRRLVPCLIAVGIALTALGDVLWTALDHLGADTDVSIADPAWFASYVALCAALWVVLRSRSGSRVDVDVVLDVVTILAVSVIIFWSISIDSIIADHTVTPFVRATWAAYPVADAVLLALVVRVLISRSTRAAIGASFAVGVSLWLAADIAYLRWGEVGGAAEMTMETGWMLAPALMARSAWRARGIQQAHASGTPSISWVAQMLVAVGPLLVPPALELVADLRNEPEQPLQLSVGTTILVTLAFVRAGRLVREKERALRALEEARDKALGASRAKSMFLANMSHEIRTPLTTVLATAEMLEDTPLDDLQVTLLGKMHRSGALLKRLIEETLDFSRIEAGQVTLSATAFDLHALVASIVDSYKPRANHAGLRFECQLDPEVPHTVVGDSARLLQILTNFLENALKFTDQGGVTLVVRRAKSDGAGSGGAQLVEFIVADTGIGIRDVDQESVFDSFKQVDGSITRRYGGSGLGLAICKELTELMGGVISVQSQLGAGSTFTIRIPLATTDPIPEPLHLGETGSSTEVLHPAAPVPS